MGNTIDGITVVVTQEKAPTENMNIFAQARHECGLHGSGISG